MEIVADTTKRLHPELCELIKQHADAQVIQDKFDELYGDVEENVRKSLAEAMHCYTLHHHHPEYKYEVQYTAGSEYNPLLTLVWDEIGAVTRKYQVPPLRTATECVHGLRFLDCDTEDTGDAEITRQRRHVLSSVLEQCGREDFLDMLYEPTYGIFQDGDLETSEETVVLDVILEHDAVDVLRLLLKHMDYIDMREWGIDEEMIQVGRELNAFACVKELAGYHSCTACYCPRRNRIG